jgi:hypothetical protein
MGVLTVAQADDGWIVLEDGRRVGGTLRDPFSSQEAAQRYVEREKAREARVMARGDVAASAGARAIRDLDAEIWARFTAIEEDASMDDAAKEAAHQAAGTSFIMLHLAMVGLEAKGELYRTGEMRDGLPVFAAKKYSDG